MDVEPALIANGEATEAAHPGQRTLNDPPVPAQLPAALDPAAGDAGLDAATAAAVAAAPLIIGLVAVHLVRPATWAARLARYGWDRVEQVLERHAVVDIGPGQQEGERDAAPVGDEVALGARLAAIRRVRPDRGSPLFAGTAVLSTQARLQSIRSASRRRHSNSRCSRSHTPACCQSRSRRQQVTPEPQPISTGSISQGMPERRTNRMPVNAARFGTDGRPPLGFGGSGGSSGSRIDQSSSETRGAAMPPRSVQTYPASRI